MDTCCTALSRSGNIVYAPLSFLICNRPDELIALLKGKSRVGVILNAADGGPAEKRQASLDREFTAMIAMGLDPVEIDLRQFFGRSGALRETFEQFDLLWVRGGNTFVLRRAFHLSGADEIIRDLLGRDAIVYGGYSAAIDLFTPSLHGSELVDNPDVVPEGYVPEIVWEGLGLIPYSVAPHYRSDHPESESVEKMVQYFIDNHILFVALRDGEVIVVDDSGTRIVG